jgi:hypothetical protein
MLDRDSTYNNIIDRIDRLEARVEDLRDVARPSEVVIYENAEWQALAGWVSTGSVLRSLDGEIILDPSIPMIQVGTGGYIQSEDFVAGTSGFQINGGTAEFNDVVVRGTIYADLGEIGGWVIGTNTLTADAGAVGLNSEATGGVDWRIWAGNAVPANAPFRVDESGNLVATSATITGTITATSGTIGGWTINAASLTGGDVTLHSTGYLLLGTGNDIVRLDAANATYRLWIGHATDSSAPFSVTKAGAVKATSGTVGGWTLGTYTLTAGAGTVGLNSEATGGVDWRIWAGNAVPANAPFRVDESGNLVASSANITGTIDANAGHLGSLDVDGVITVGLVAPYLEIDGPNKRIESSTYAAGISGMQIQANGDAECNNVRIRGALTSSTFVKDLVEARAGSMLIVKSGGVLHSDMAVPGAGTWAMTIEDPPGGGFLFENSDICRCKTEYAAGIGDIWFTVSARVDNGDGTQNYTCTYDSGTRSITYPAGAPVLDYGVSGDGGLYLTADDTNGPFIDVFTHAGVPWTTITERVRMGNLNGVGDYVADAYGIFIGDYAGDMWMSYDPTNSLRIRGDALIDGTVSAEALVMGDYDFFFSSADGLLLLGPYCGMTATSWESTRGQTATISGAFHQVAGPWAESRALVVEATTTNYELAPRMIESGSTGLAAGWAYFDDFGSGGDATLDVVAHPITERGWLQQMTYTAAVGDNADYCVVSDKTATGSFAQGDSVTVSFDALGELSGCTFYIVILELDASDVAGTSHSSAISLDGSLGRYEFTTTLADADCSKLQIGMTVAAVDDGDSFDLRFGAVNVEKTAYATSFCCGALAWCAWSGTEDNSTSIRTATEVNLDTYAPIFAGRNTISFLMWVQAPYDSDALGEWGTGHPVVFDLYHDASNCIRFIYNATATGYFYLYINGTSMTTGATAISFVAGDWLHLAITIDFSNDIYIIYLNGAAVLTTTNSLSAPGTLDQMNIGCAYAPSSRWGGAVAEFASFGRVLTAEEVAALYIRGKPLADAGAFTKPGIYILDGLFKLASSTTGLRTELTAAGLGIYNGAGLTSVGRVLVGMVDTTGTVLDETATDLGMFGYDAADTLQVAWYASGTNAGKIVAGAGNVWMDDDGIRLEATTGKFSASSIEWYDGASLEFSIGCEVDLGAVTNGYLSANSGLVLESASGSILLDAAVYTKIDTGYLWVDEDARFAGGIAVGSGLLNPDTGAIHFVERSSDPTEPSEGQAVIWMSNGTGKGDDGDVLIASKAGGSTTYAILFDHSAGSAW